MGVVVARLRRNFAIVKTIKPITIMDYDQDYSKLNATDNKWYDFNNRNQPDATPESAGKPGAAQPRQEVTADMLDNEDFD